MQLRRVLLRPLQDSAQRGVSNGSRALGHGVNGHAEAVRAVIECEMDRRPAWIGRRTRMKIGGAVAEAREQIRGHDDAGGEGDQPGVAERSGLELAKLLDISHRPPEFVKEHFPNIYEKLLTLGIDMTREPIPVVPAQHYTCGGVVIDLDGRTDLPGLYAAGECTESGLHGANRLASNSLLECFVFGEAAAAHILSHWTAFDAPPSVMPWDESRVSEPDEEVVIKQNWAEIRRFMWNYVGIVRTTKRLERAMHRIQLLNTEVEEYYRHFRVSTDLIELRNLLQSADLIVRSALKRHESRGLHYTLNFPQTDDEPVDTILVP